MALDDLEQRLKREIGGRGAEMLADLAQWVAIPTGGGHAPGLDQYRHLLCARLTRLGATVTLEAGDARPAWILGEAADGPVPPIAVVRKPGRGPKVVLGGHLDTVHDPRGPFQTLAVAPDGARAVGPGAADMKGGLLVAIVALEAIARAGVDLDWTFILNSDEETGSYCSDRVIRSVAAGKDYGLVFEPALPDGSLVVERPGSGQFALRAVGKPAHVGRDFKSGVSAITALCEKVVEISKHADPDRGRIVNVGVVKGGAATNIVPDEAWAWGNVRFGGENASQTQADLAAAIEGLAGITPSGAAIEVMMSFARPAKPKTPGVERLAAMARGCAEDLGQKLPFGVTGGVCDGNNMQSAGVPVIDTLGVRGGGLHTPQEWIDVPSLVERAQLAAVLMARLARS